MLIEQGDEGLRLSLVLTRLIVQRETKLCQHGSCLFANLFCFLLFLIDAVFLRDLPPPSPSFFTLGRIFLYWPPLACLAIFSVCFSSREKEKYTRLLRVFNRDGLSCADLTVLTEFFLRIRRYLLPFFSAFPISSKKKKACALQFVQEKCSRLFRKPGQSAPVRMVSTS